MMGEDAAFRIDALTVQAGRIACEVSVDPRHRFTTQAMADALLEDHPSLLDHACVNECGPSFGAVIAHTSLPHLFEHLVIDIQARTEGRSDATFVGMTEWIEEREGRALVTVNFTDDLVALRAFRDAARKIVHVMLK